MTETLARRLSLGVFALVAVLGVVSLTVSVQAGAHPPTSPIVVGDPTVADGGDALDAIRTLVAEGTTRVGMRPNPSTLAALVLAFLWMGTGSLIVSRQARNPAGWIFLAIGTGSICEAFGAAITTWALYGGHALPAQGVFALMGETSLLPVLLLPLLFLLYPTGRPPVGWSWLVWMFAGAIGLILVGYVLGPGPLNNFVDAGILYANPVGIEALAGVSGAFTAVGTITMLLGALATVLAVRSRYRRSAGEERQQLRWLVAVATLVGIFLGLAIVITLAGFLVTRNGDGPPIFPALLVLSVLTLALGVPGAYLVAIFRYRLWDLDVVIRKAAIALALAFAIAFVVLLPLVIASQVALWNGPPRLLSLAVGLVLGLAFVPLVRLARRIADRIVYGRRATPYEVLTEFSGRIAETYASDDVLARMAQILAAGTGAVGAAVLLRLDGELRDAARVGEPSNESMLVPVTFRDEELGALAVSMPPNDPIDPARERLVRDLAAQAGPVLHNVRLIEDLRASRQRLVAAQDEERRKLERNIHDGVQQQLVALAVKLRLVDALVDRDPAAAHERLTALQADATTTLEDLRDLARGIYPPLLADKGLGPALEAQARKAAVPVSVEDDGVGRFTQDVEATVYFCALEALNNVAKYANATHAQLRLARSDGHLRFEISDDGTGFDPASTRNGTGLRGMADRLAAVGGSLDVRSTPGSGTTVAGSVPVESG